jgi:hypothetical protein
MFHSKRPAAAASGHAIDAQLGVRREAAHVLDEIACEEEHVRYPIRVPAEFENTLARTIRKNGHSTYPFAVVEGEHHLVHRVITAKTRARNQTQLPPGPEREILPFALVLWEVGVRLEMDLPYVASKVCTIIYTEIEFGIPRPRIDGKLEILCQFPSMVKVLEVLRPFGHPHVEVHGRTVIEGLEDLAPLILVKFGIHASIERVSGAPVHSEPAVPLASAHPKQAHRRVLPPENTQDERPEVLTKRLAAPEEQEECF